MITTNDFKNVFTEEYEVIKAYKELIKELKEIKNFLDSRLIPCDLIYDNRVANLIIKHANTMKPTHELRADLGSMCLTMRIKNGDNPWEDYPEMETHKATVSSFIRDIYWKNYWAVQGEY